MGGAVNWLCSSPLADHWPRPGPMAANRWFPWAQHYNDLFSLVDFITLLFLLIKIFPKISPRIFVALWVVPPPARQRAISFIQPKRRRDIKMLGKEWKRKRRPASTLVFITTFQQQQCARRHDRDANYVFIFLLLGILHNVYNKNK